MKIRIFRFYLLGFIVLWILIMFLGLMPSLYFSESDKLEELASVLVKSEKKLSNRLFLQELHYRELLISSYKSDIETIDVLLKSDSSKEKKINLGVILKNTLPKKIASFNLPLDIYIFPFFLVSYDSIKYVLSIDQNKIDNIVSTQQTGLKEFVNILQYQDCISTEKILYKHINVTRVILVTGLLMFFILIAYNGIKRNIIRRKESLEKDVDEELTDVSISVDHLEMEKENNASVGEKIKHLVDKLEFIKVKNSIDIILAKNIRRSRQESKELYNRAYLMLMAGLIMAFVGMAIFYFTLPSQQNIYIGTTDFLRSIIRPSLILIFIEGIAWYLLRQYRLLIEDFKYFHKIYLKKVNYLAAFKILSEKRLGEDEKNAQIITALFILQEDINDKLKNGESTEKIEVEKLNDASPFYTVIDKLLSTIKSKD